MKKTLLLAISCVLLSSSLLPAESTARPTKKGLRRPVVIGHRGASGYRPEHTLAAYRLAVEQGADFVEPDLVITRDGVLVARHENDISETTDVADHPEFADRKTCKTIDGRPITGWFVEDFSLAEIKTLRARGRTREGKAYDGKFDIPTFQEMIDLVHQLEKETGRTIGIYPETKHPSYFRSLGLPLEEPMLETLRKNGYEDRPQACYIQSFEVGNLRELRKKTRIPLMQLVDDEGSPPDFVASGDARSYADLISPAGLAEVAKYADGVAVAKSLIVPRRSDGSLGSPTQLVRQAHDHHLLVHSWTFRAENQALPKEYRRGQDPAGLGDLSGEAEVFFKLGLDGMFANHPDQAVAGLRRAKGK